jgi:hypothetical protein
MAKILAAFLFVVIVVTGTFIFIWINNAPSDSTTEVCTRSHTRKIPVTQLDGRTTLVPAERCDHYKIVKND